MAKPRQVNGNNSQGDDFTSAENYLQRQDYDADVEDIRSRLDSIESKVKDNDCFAETFNKAFVSSKKLDKTIEDAVVSLIQTNTHVKDAISGKVRETDRDWQKAAMKKVGLAVWTILVSLLSGGVVYLLVK